jgi:hypothetical protein
MLVKLFLVALLVLPLTMTTGATATAAETEITLLDKVITTSDLRREVAANGSTVEFGASEDVASAGTSEVARVMRFWKGEDGSVMFVLLQAYRDGSGLSAADRSYLLDGEYGREFVGGAFDSYAELEGSSEVLDANDLGQQFKGKKAGRTFEVITVTFISGGLSGLVMYATPLTNAGVELGAAYGAQYVKLH